MVTRFELVSVVEDAISTNMVNEGEVDSWLQEEARLEIAEVVIDVLEESGYITLGDE